MNDKYRDRDTDAATEGPQSEGPQCLVQDMSPVEMIDIKIGNRQQMLLNAAAEITELQVLREFFFRQNAAYAGSQKQTLKAAIVRLIARY